MPSRKTESVRHLSYESALAKPLLFSSKYFHLLVFMLFSTNTSIMVQHNSSSITNIVSWLETAHCTHFIVCRLAFPGEESPACSKASFVFPGYYSSVDTAPSPGFFIYGHIESIMLISHCEATFFGSWLLSQQDPRKILCTVSVPLLEQLHLQQDLG